MTDQPAPSPRRDGFAVTALVLGIIALIVGLVPYLGLATLLLLGPLAVIFGIVAMLRTKDDVRPGRGMARTGLILGIVGIVAAIIWVLVVGWAIDRFYTSMYGGGERLTAGGATAQTAVPFGTPSQYPNGMVVSAAPPVPATIPSDLADIGGFTVGVQSTITFANTSDEPIAWEPGASFYYLEENSTCRGPEDTPRPPAGQMLAAGATETITVTGYCYDPSSLGDGSSPPTSPTPAPPLPSDMVSLKVLPAPYTYDVTWFSGPLPVN